LKFIVYSRLALQTGYEPIERTVMATKKKTAAPKNLTLDEIRQAIVKADARRLDPALDQESRQAIEETCLTLREAERLAINDMETGLVKGFEQCAGSVRLQAKEIRALTTRMNRIPKVLGTTETVIKECVKVLKAIASWTLVLLLIVCSSACASMTKAQLKRVTNMAGMVDSISAGPGQVFEMLSQVRTGRGIYYAASLSQPDMVLRELSSLYTQGVKDEKLARKAYVPQNVLASYVRALKALSADTRWKSPGTDMRGIGRNIDSLFIAYNKLEWVDKEDRIETGTAREAGKSAGWLTEQYVKRRQRYLVKKMLVQGDTVVKVCCDSLIAILKSPEMAKLIDYESQRLDDDFKAYLQSRTSAEPLELPASIEPYRDYMDLKDKLAQASALKKNSISWLQSFAKAHHALLDEMDKIATYQELSDALFELSEQTLAITGL